MKYSEAMVDALKAGDYDVSVSLSVSTCKWGYEIKTKNDGSIKSAHNNETNVTAENAAAEMVNTVLEARQDGEGI